MKKILKYTILCIILSGYSTSIPATPEKFKIYSKKRTYSPAYKALNWLKAQQNKDGSWGAKESRDVLTPLVTLSFMSLGETPASEEYGDTVLKGIRAVVDRIKDDKGELSEPAKTVSMWCLAETYAMTRIPILKIPLEQWLEKGDFDFKNPWTLFALKACFCGDLGDKEEMQDNLESCMKSLKTIPLDNLFNAATVINGYRLLGETKEKMQLFKKFWELSPEQWRKSEKPMLTALNMSMMLWESALLGGNKKDWKWYKKFRKKIWASQIKKNDIGWWSEKKIRIESDTEYAFPNLSEDDKSIYITSIIIISIPPRRWMPTFKVPNETQKKTEDCPDDLRLKLE